jgi:hypothetical protein
MVTAALASLVVAGVAAAAEPLAGLAWLEGDWTAVGGGGPGQASGGFSFHRDVGGSVLVRRNFANYPAQGGRPAQRHEDLMVIYREGDQARATYWDSEGQTIRYAVTSATPEDVVFVGDSSPASPMFRLSYHRTASGLEGKFEIAPPPARDRFQTYLTWTARRGYAP